MIDYRYHRHGFGARALRLVLQHIAEHTAASRVLLSFVPDNNNAEPFYTRFGFVRTGEVDDGEVVMALDFNASAYAASDSQRGASSAPGGAVL
jgi:diamine N-acetyltransferase